MSFAETIHLFLKTKYTAYPLPVLPVYQAKASEKTSIRLNAKINAVILRFFIILSHLLVEISVTLWYNQRQNKLCVCISV